MLIFCLCLSFRNRFHINFVNEVTWSLPTQWQKFAENTELCLRRFAFALVSIYLWSLCTFQINCFEFNIWTNANTSFTIKLYIWLKTHTQWESVFWFVICSVLRILMMLMIFVGSLWWKSTWHCCWNRHKNLNVHRKFKRFMQKYLRILMTRLPWCMQKHIKCHLYYNFTFVHLQIWIVSNSVATLAHSFDGR